MPLLVDGAQSAGAIAVERRRARLLHRVRRRNGSARPTRPARSTSAIRELVRVKSPSYFSQESYELSGAFVARTTSARASTRGWIGVPSLVGLVAALGTHPEWRYERAAEMAARCRELLEPHVEVVTPPGHSTLVSFRPHGDPTELVQSLQDAGRDRARAPGPQPRARLVRLVDERGRPAAARRASADFSGRRLFRPSSAAIGCSAATTCRGCGRRARRRAPPRPCRRPRDARRLRTTAASASCAPTSARGPRARSGARARTHGRSRRARRTRRAPSSAACRAAAPRCSACERTVSTTSSGIALLAEDRRAVLRVLVERRMHLVVEVVEQRGDAPELLVAAELRAYAAVDASTASACRRSDSLFVYFVSVSQACSRVGPRARLA